jgi:hypothetical protein
MDDHEPRRWDVYDRYGNNIYMTAERWQHAIESRPWLAGYHEETLTALRRGRRKQDSLNPHKYKYYWPCDDLLPNFNHLVVVVLMGQTTDAQGQVIPNNYVANVWAVFLYGHR